MEEDSEILDWGNEDDEHHESLRKPPSNNDQRETGEIDAEDSISLGDEDEDTATALLTTGAKQDSQQFSGDATHDKISTPCKSSFSEDSPLRKQHSLSSPQRSQPNPSRLTHALPLKPVTTSGRPRTPHPHQAQTSRPRRNSAHMPPDREMDNGTRTVLLAPLALSYEDRHYRPGGDPPRPSGDPYRPSGDPYRPSGDSYRPSGDSSSGQNVYTNDPRKNFETLQSHSDYAERHWVRSPPPDFSRSDRDSSRRLERRHNDEPIDEYPDSRNRSSLRRRESSSEPKRNQGLPPRPSEFRDDANQNPAARSTLSASSHPPLPSCLHAPAIRTSSYSRLVMMSLIQAAFSNILSSLICCVSRDFLAPPSIESKTLIMDTPFTFFSPFNPFTVMSSLLIKFSSLFLSGNYRAWLNTTCT